MNPTDQATPNGKRKKFALILLLLLIAGAGAIGYWFLFSRNRVSTENAYVTADSAAVSSRVAGSVARVLVENDSQVEEGGVLVELDPRDFQAEVDKQRAALGRIEAQIEVAEVTIRLTESQTGAGVQIAEAAVGAMKDREQEVRCRMDELERARTAAEAEYNNVKRDYERYLSSYQRGAVSEQLRDTANTNLKKTKAQFEATNAQIAASKASLAATLQEIERTKGQLTSAKADRLKVEIEKSRLASLKAERAETEAELRAAELNLSYCVIRAPLAGSIAQRRVQVGERVAPGQPLMAIVPLQAVYVEANFKETQLADVRLGQPVDIWADLYPGRTFRGKVSGIRAGTGAAFSLLPPENATGNWIKIVQRIPVRIELDTPPPPEFSLPVGSSLHVTVNTVDRSGPRLRVASKNVRPAKAALGDGRP